MSLSIFTCGSLLVSGVGSFSGSPTTPPTETISLGKTEFSLLLVKFCFIWLSILAMFSCYPPLLIASVHVSPGYSQDTTQTRPGCCELSSCSSRFKFSSYNWNWIFFPFTSSERTQKTTILTASQGVTNQTKQVITWNKLYFPSHSELINKYNYSCCKEYFNSLMLAGDINKEACCRCSDSFLLYFYLCLIKLSRLRGQLQLQENNSGLER